MSRTPLILAGLTSLLLSPALMANQLNVGLNADPDMLDPDQGRTMVGRVVFTSLFDKLIDIDEQLNYVPQLATDWRWLDNNHTLEMDLREGVTFHDGTPFNAEAVKFNIERSLNAPYSTRKSEVDLITEVVVVDEYKVQFKLAEPFAPLLASLADRAGMMVSPTAAEATDKGFASHPVGTGPYQFKSRKEQDRIELTKYDGYWNADAYHFDSVTYVPIPDNTVRLANLQAGQLDIIERIAPTDAPRIESASDIELVSATGLGFMSISFNLGHNGYKPGVVGSNAKVREAFEYSIDRNILNQVAFSGQYLAGNQWVPPTSPYYDNKLQPTTRDVAKAKALLKEAGHEKVSFELMIPNDPLNLQIGQIMQAMSAEAGFDVKLVATEFATAVGRQAAGDFESFLVGWSGRVDPDGNIHLYYDLEGSRNENGYLNADVDRLVNQARQETDQATRQALYGEAMQQVMVDRPRIYLYHQKWQWAHKSEISGVGAWPDGMLRLEGVQR